MKCEKCGGDAPMLIDGWCGRCNPLRRCREVRDGRRCVGVLESRPLPDWMNLFKCNVCGKEVSR